MTIYLHCEGVTDYAVIPALIKKIYNSQKINIQWIKRDILKNFRMHRKRDIIISGHYKNIKALAVYSLQNGSKYIAYHQDADTHYTEVYNAIISEFKPLMGNGFFCLAIVPKETIESWLLADDNAYPAIPCEPKLPSKPEEIWGQKSNTNSNHPYNYFVRVLAQFRLTDNRDVYAQIAENSCIEVLKNRCPKSFGQFYDDVQSFVSEEAAS